ncbi:MAG: hypothetical protein GY915_01675 [bacterium]|nr:hypothetical protein [bacterium]
MTAKKKALDKVEDSTVDANKDEAPKPLPIGDILQNTRLKRKGTLPRIAAALKIRQAYLKALEEGDTSELPEPVFTLGFLRSYALYLGLDAQELVDRYQEEFKQTKKSVDLTMPSPLSKEGVPKRSILIISLTLALVIAAGWGLYQRTQNSSINVFSKLLSPVPKVVSPPQLPAPAPLLENRGEAILEDGQVEEETPGEFDFPALSAEESRVLPERQEISVVESLQ